MFLTTTTNGDLLFEAIVEGVLQAEENIEAHGEMLGLLADRADEIKGLCSMYVAELRKGMCNHGTVQPRDVQWLSLVRPAKVELSKACLAVKVFAENQEEVERLSEQLNGLTAARECFVGVVGLGVQRALAHERSGELLLELRKASTRLHER